MSAPAVPTPPMGWNSWNCFRCEIDEAQIRDVAEAMVSSGMRDAGYVYLNLDDGWMAKERDADGALQPDPVRFPSGIRSLADHVHGLGLKLGIYGDAGTLTCGGYPGNDGHFAQDAASYASWGVDLLKFDWCHTGEGDDPRARYEEMRAALDATGRPILLSACNWGIDEPWHWGPGVAPLVRSTGDITDSWDSVLNILDQHAEISVHGAPERWLDPDMLEVGNGGMTLDEYRAHFSLWAILAAPLIAGHDLRAMGRDVREILLNAEVIAVDQDPLGRPGRRVSRADGHEIWARELAGGDLAVVLLNRGPTSRRVAVDAAALGIGGGPHAVRDLWTGREHAAGTAIDAFVGPRSAAMLRIRPDAGAGLPWSPAPDFSPTFFPAGAARRLAVTARELRVPDGWTASPDGADAWTVTAPADAEPGLHELEVGNFTAIVRVPPPAPAPGTRVSELPWLDAVNGAWSGWYPEVRRDRAIRGRTLTLRGREYEHGLGVHAFSQLWYYLGGACTRFRADVGVDDHLDPEPPFAASTLADGTVAFEVWGDGVLLHATGVVTRADAAVALDVDVTGVEVLCLSVLDGGDGTFRDYADWAGAVVA